MKEKTIHVIGVYPLILIALFGLVTVDWIGNSRTQKLP